MQNVEFVSFEDCREIGVGSEDEVIAQIDANREAEYQADLAKGSPTLIEAVHVARRFFL